MVYFGGRLFASSLGYSAHFSPRSIKQVLSFTFKNMDHQNVFFFLHLLLLQRRTKSVDNLRGEVKRRRKSG